MKNRQKSPLLLLVVLLIFILSGCAPPPTPDNKLTVRDCFPQTPGNTWEYEGYGNEYAEFNAKILYSNNDLVQVSESNGGTVMTFIYRITDTEITRVYREEESYDPPNMLEQGFTPNDETILLKAPLQAGTEWNAGDAAIQIVSVDAALTTPAGTFDNCVKLELTYPDAKVYKYYKEGIGLVKQEFVTDDINISSTLKNYDIQ